MTLSKVILIGGGGTLGPHILNALIATKQFSSISVLSRQSSRSTYDEYGGDVQDVRVADDMKIEDLVREFKNHDALIISMITGPDVSIRFIDAAFEAGTIQRVIPADFGSCDSSDERSLNVLPLYRNKKKVRDYLVELSRKRSTFTWTSLITGHFLDFGIKSGLMSIDVTKRKARIFDGGKVKVSATTLSSIGLATAKVLQHEEETRNKLVYVQSQSFTQWELLRAVEKVVGGPEFAVEDVDSDEFIRVHKKKLEDLGRDDDELREELVSVEGIVNADWTGRDGFANELLGMPDDQSLEDIVRKALE